MRLPYLCLAGLLLSPFAMASTYVIDNAAYTLTINDVASVYSDNESHDFAASGIATETYGSTIKLPTATLPADSNYVGDYSFSLVIKSGWTLAQVSLDAGANGVLGNAATPTISATGDFTFSGSYNPSLVNFDSFYSGYPQQPGDTRLYAWDYYSFVNTDYSPATPGGPLRLAGLTGVDFSGHLELNEAAGVSALGDSFNPLLSVSVIRAVPEPETWAMLGIGLVGLVATRRRTRKH